MTYRWYLNASGLISGTSIFPPQKSGIRPSSGAHSTYGIKIMIKTMINDHLPDDVNQNDDDSEVALTVIDELSELALRSMDRRKEFSQIFIADTGASGHMSGSTEGMTNLRKCNDSVVVGNGQKAIQSD